MKRVGLIIEEMKKKNFKNRIMFIFIELIILLVTYGFFHDRDESYYFNFSVVVILLIFAIGLIFYQVYIINLVKFCESNYQTNQDEVIIHLQKYKRFYISVFNFANINTLLIEVLNSLQNEKFYPNQNTIGPWEIKFDYEKTKTYSDAFEPFIFDMYKEVKENIDYLPTEVKELLNAFGIDYHKIYDIWDDDKASHYYELMYPIIGMITNDYQYIYHKAEYDAYMLNDNISIRPYETYLLDHENEAIILIIRCTLLYE